jgi:regulator of nucleoside diphosphate kinase
MNLALLQPARPPRRSAKRPPLVMIDSEADALFDLAIRWQRLHPLSAGLLLDELDRARTVAAGELPGDVVTMRSRVVFLVDATGERHSVQLVYPSEADMAQQRVSILTPIGAGLIGMRVGSAIDWPNRQGERRRLKIVEVRQPAPETTA